MKAKARIKERGKMREEGDLEMLHSEFSGSNYTQMPLYEERASRIFIRKKLWIQPKMKMCSEYNLHVYVKKIGMVS